MGSCILLTVLLYAQYFLIVDWFSDSKACVLTGRPEKESLSYSHVLLPGLLYNHKLCIRWCVWSLLRRHTCIFKTREDALSHSRCKHSFPFLLFRTWSFCWKIIYRRKRPKKRRKTNPPVCLQQTLQNVSFLALWKYCFALPDCRLIAVATVPGTSRSATNRSPSSASICPTPRNSAGIASIPHTPTQNTLIFRLPNWSTSCNVFVGAVMIITGSLFTGWIAVSSSFLES